MRRLDRDLLPPPPRDLPSGALSRSVRYRLRSAVLAWIGGAFLFVALVTSAIFIPLAIREWRPPRHEAPPGGPLVAERVGSEPAPAPLQPPPPFWTIFALVFPGIFGTLGGILFHFGYREIMTPSRLYRAGAEAVGDVTGTSIVATEKINGRRPTRIHYRYADSFGTVHTGDMKTTDDRLLGMLPAGTPVTVLYDPARPDRSTMLSAMGVDDPRAAGERAR